MTLPRISVARLEHNPERRGNLDREAPLNCLAKILLKLFDIVALRGAAWDRGDFGPKAVLLRFMHDDLDLHFKFRIRSSRAQSYSAACAFTSAETWRMARARSSGACAPDTAYFCANT